MLTISEIKTLINNDKTSERKQCAKVGKRYYNGDHDIKSYKLYYYDGEGNLKEDKTRSNIKISHPFFTEIVDQAVQYLLGGDGCHVKSDDPKLQERLDEYFGDGFNSELADTVTDVCTCGFGYMYAYKNAKDRLSFVYASADGVVEVRDKDSDDHVAYTIYWYTDRIDKGKKKITRIQVWDAEKVRYYVQVGEGEIKEDKDEPLNPRPHIVYERENNEGRYGDKLGFIPFFRIDSDRRQTSHLKPIKALIDDYDLMACGLSNNLQDITEGLYVVKGYDGDNLDEIIQNIRTKKHIGVSADGGVDIKTIDIPYEARKVKLDIDEKNIYRFGMAFNSAQLGDGNITNVVIRSRYALLDLKCNKLERRIRAFLQKSVKMVLDEINKENGTNYQMKHISFDFPREIITNAADDAVIDKTEAEIEQIKLTTILDAAAKLDDETVLHTICDLLDLDYDAVNKKLPAGGAISLNAASEALANAVTGDE